MHPDESGFWFRNSDNISLLLVSCSILYSTLLQNDAGKEDCIAGHGECGTSLLGCTCYVAMISAISRFCYLCRAVLAGAYFEVVMG